MKLRFVPLAELERIRSLPGELPERVGAFADACRINVLYMVARAGSGHLGTSFSSLDIVAWLHLHVLREGDRYFSSKGHDAPALYAVLIGTGRLEFDLLHRLRRLDGLPGHPDVTVTPEVTTSTGSLGMGVSKARGLVLADRLAGRTGDVYVLTGDGELQEGQFWESLQPTANRGLHELTVIVDRNKLQSDTWVERVSALGDLEAKLEAFGWAVGRCNGNDIAALEAALRELRAAGPERPKILIADTRKGAGVSFMEPNDLADSDTSLYGFHSGAPSAEEYERALEELVRRLDARLETLGAGAVQLECAEAPVRVAPARPERLVQAYGATLVAAGEADERIVVLDADLRLDCGLVDFRARFPDRFFECGIAEQDMVSQAGAMALAGRLPVVHSFASFLATRANEQIFNNASEGTRIVYTGSLAGILPGGPGHSHQSVRDVALMASVPGLVALEPASEEETALAVDWALHEATGPVYLRLVSVPWELGLEWPPDATLEPGRGTVLREGTDGAFVATGPILVSQAASACRRLAADGISFGLIALPWLNTPDGAWLAETVSGVVVCLDNHVATGGQAHAIAASVAAARPDRAADVVRHGVDGLPVCGANDEVLRAHRLDADGIAEAARRALMRLEAAR
jgi:transketolase